MAVIQGRGLKLSNRNKLPKARVLVVSDEYWRRIKKESVWVKAQGEELLSALLLPPLQVVAAGLNFCTLCVINQHLFSLPFESLEAIKYSEDLIKGLKNRSDSLGSRQSAPGTRGNSETSESPVFEPEPVIESVTRSEANEARDARTTAERNVEADRQPSF
jgi:hypothetical protein